MTRISLDTPCYYFTSVTHHRLPVFRTDKFKDLMCKALNEARTSSEMLIFAYVIMLDHFHIITDGKRKISDTLRYLNGISARRLIDHLKEIYIDGELDTVETSNWHAKVGRKDYMVGLNLTGLGVDDPDAMFYENYACGSERNYTGYCNKELQALFDKQSMMDDQEARKKLVWEIDRKLQEDGARPIIFNAKGATCYQPHVKGYTVMSNSSYNGYRFEDVWLDK